MIQSTMRAVQISKNGGRSVMKLQEIPVPRPKSTEILVKNSFIGVNFIDTYFRSGLYPTLQFPLTLGKEAAGSVAMIGEKVKDFQKGDRVVYSASKGAYAEYTIVDTTAIVKIPDGIDERTAAASFIQGLTAITLTQETYKVQKGDYILVHAAAGGMGGWLCQILKRLGAHVIATASTRVKLDLAASNGAEFLINYANEDVVRKVKEIVPEGVHCVYDGVGKDTLDISLNCLRRKGFFASFGNASGAVPPLPIFKLTPKNLKMARPQLFGYLETKEELDYYSSELWKLIQSKEFKVPIHHVYPLEEVQDAQEALEERASTGKILMSLQRSEH